ncbi:MAG: cell envelope integrity protein TolA [Gammaproteobacteria bacterium]|nr:cell envelope integrity protein TolA [Gammaproteobacteria bacterium]MCP4090647.1 cell envelope integrity protein TolA [Gammaproteobacteria bacterium]MCP4274805.1 cell envelope integrity protein TolA [Gammaproteobacteria bacterium]MCP4832194.1 cell envelope integrity protein TolA [Gammaproteobacteria bacterium]MCP4928169.1 cell envelope integrity protein TolA [Gammaproteobacteria bacterium]
MAVTATLPGFALEHRSGLALSILIHGLILLAFSTSLILSPKVQLQQLAIEAVVVDEGAIKRAADAVKRNKEFEAQQQREKEARQTQLEQERRALEQRKQQELVAAEKQQRLDQQRRADKARQQAEAARQQAERDRIEKQQAEAKRRSIEERKQREAKARAEAERQRMLAEAEREERERREAEMALAMQAEEALLAASQSGEMSRYIALIQQRVERNWVRPASAQPGLECELAVKQLPGGDVIDVRTVRCNGDDTVKRSIENAVRRSSPLPMPENRVLFDRNLSFVFKPD